MLLRTLIFFLLLWFEQNYCVADDDGKKLQLLSINKLRGHLLGHRDDFFCVLIKNPDNMLETLEMEIMLKDSKFERVVLGTVINSTEVTKLTETCIDKLPLLRCFFGSPKYKDYSGPINHSQLSKWTKQMTKKHKKLMSKDVQSIEDAITANEVIVLAMPFIEQTINAQRVLQKISSRLKSQCSLSVLLIHPNSRHQSAIRGYYGIPQRSSMVVFVKKDSNKEIEKTVFTGQNVDSTQIISYILSRLIPVKHLTADNFRHETLTVKATERFQPYIVAFYAWWAKHSLDFLSSFKSAVEHFKSSSVLAKFALVNVAEEKAVIPAFLKVYKPLPFIIVFQRETGKYTVNQTTLQDISHPSPFYLYQSIQSMGISLEDVWGKPWSYAPYKVLNFTQFSDNREGPLGTMCTAWAHNETDSTFISTTILMDSIPEEKTPMTKTIEDLLPRYHGVPILTENFWDASIKKSESNFGVYTSASNIIITIFAFIRSGCGSCNSKMDVFKEIHQEIKKMENSQFLLVNCSLDVSLCQTLSVNGYPSIVAFRNFAALATERCVIPTADESTVRRDYHGPIDTWSLYKWYKHLTLSSAQLLGFDPLPPLSKMETDVRLIATLMPKTSVYLPIAPNRDRNYFYSLSCFRLACELLYGLASCQLVYSSKIPATEFKDKNTMVVSEIDFERKDGITMKLMSLGKSLHSLLEEETSSSLHLFHRAHQYSITPSQTCESNHDICTQIIVNFTKDHLRLPVTSLTSEIFHTRNNPLFESGKPVLIALAKPDNITASSNFMKVLDHVASTLYKDILVTVMNVDEYPAWAGTFVPKNYNKYYIAEDHPGPLHSYPRLCLVDWQDHSHAAFYPPLYKLMDGTRDTFNVSMEAAQGSQVIEAIDLNVTGNVWDSDKLILYLGMYLKDPTQFIVKTEYF